jgi:hypothetical protein
MNTAVVVAALVVAALNAIPAVLGCWLWYRGEESRSFWLLLRAAQIAVVVFVLGVGVLAAAGHYSSERLFYLYALLPVAVAFIAEQIRAATAQTILDQHGLADARAAGELAPQEQRALIRAVLRRETGVMALSAAVVVFLALRAASTAHGF